MGVEWTYASNGDNYMIAYQKLPGSLSQEGLNGILDWFGMPAWVKQYWQTIKNKINEILATGLKISTYQQRIAVAQQTLLKRGDTRGADALNDELAKINDDLQKWWKVKGYINTYLSSWMKLDENIAQDARIGFVPIVLSALAIAALAYVVNVGMALVQDYAYKSQLTQAVIDQKLSTGQMVDIISVPRSEGVVEKVISTVGIVAGVGIPTVLLIGGGLYLLFATGMLRGVLGSR